VWAGPAYGQCVQREAALQRLADQFKEFPIARGLASSGHILEVFSAQDGLTWTILATDPRGCVSFGGECLDDHKVSGERKDIVNGIPSVKVDWTINATTLLSILVAVIAGWVTLDARVAANENFIKHTQERGILPGAAAEIAALKAQIEGNRRANENILRALERMEKRQDEFFRTPR
jgi:hypothetical protein